MKKSLLLAVGGAIMGLSLHAQSTLPVPVYLLDFEGATQVGDFGGIQHGDGAIVQSEDTYFGTYYQNNPNWTVSSVRVNFLEVPTTAWSTIYNKGTAALTVGFWVNATVGNEKGFGNYWGPLFNGYNEGGCAGATWPCSFEVRYGGQIHGNNNGSWYDNNHDDIMAEVMKWSIQNEVKPDFADNWHYFTTVYTQVDQASMNYKLYVDGQLKIDQDETVSGGGNMWAQMPKLDRFCIGGNSFNWPDPDNVYAYDDVAFYAEALSEDQIQLIINLKLDQLTPDEKVIVAQSQVESSKVEFENYLTELDMTTFATLTENMNNWSGDIDPMSYETVEACNEIIKEIQAKRDETEAVVKAYEEAMALISLYDVYRNNTLYAGTTAFADAISTAEDAIADPTSTATIAAAVETLKAERVTYVFTQTGDVIDVTRVISYPWFIEEAYEPTVDGEGHVTYAEGAANHLTKEGWTLSASDALKGATDLAIYFTNGRSTANLFHSSTVAGGVLDVQQTVTGLKAGYYELSADMSSTSAPTNNHVYATAGSVTKVSAVPSSTAYTPWTDDHTWETVTTDKVQVGEDGVLTIGATATTDGTQYKGWFCVTNFQLKYYGTEYDMSEDVTEKKSDAESAIAQLILKGDKTNEQTEYEGIVRDASSDYELVSQLTAFIEKVNGIYAQEEAFKRADDLTGMQEKESDVIVAGLYEAGATAIKNALAAETTTVNDLPELEKYYAAVVYYAPTVKAAETWPSTTVTDALPSYTSIGTTAEAIQTKQGELVALMKSTIPTMEASESEPKDITALIGNASFDGDQSTAWTTTIDGGTTNVAQAEVEFYDNNTFDLAQVITDMPKGTYKLMASAFYRDGNDYATVVSNYTTKATDDSGDEPVELEETIYDQHANVKLYAKSATFEKKSPVVSIASASLSVGSEDNYSYTDYYGNVNEVMDGKDFYRTLDSEADPVVYYPYWMWDAYDMVTNRGAYADNEVVFVIEEEKQDITIGGKKTARIAGDWTIMDNFRLFYLGQEIPVGIEAVKEAAGTKAQRNGKFFENGRIVIYKAGQKFNVAGQVIK